MSRFKFLTGENSGVWKTKTIFQTPKTSLFLVRLSTSRRRWLHGDWNTYLGKNQYV